MNLTGPKINIQLVNQRHLVSVHLFICLIIHQIIHKRYRHDGGGALVLKSLSGAVVAAGEDVQLLELVEVKHSNAKQFQTIPSKTNHVKPSKARQSEVMQSKVKQSKVQQGNFIHL